MTVGEFIVASIALISEIAKIIHNVQTGVITVAEGEASIAAAHKKLADDRAVIDTEAAKKFATVGVTP